MRFLTALAIPTALLLGACEWMTGPELGRLRAVTLTTGGDLDEDGYHLSIDGGTTRALVVNGTAEIADLTLGTHVVAIVGVAGNCDLGGPAERTVTIQSGRTADIVFEVVCHATGVQVNVVTGGSDIDGDGYLVQIGSAGHLSLNANGAGVLSRMSPGTYELVVSGLAGNCLLHGEARRTLEVLPRQVTALSLTISCVSTTGTIEVAVVSVGVDLDPNGYFLRVPGLAHYDVAANSVVSIERLFAGAYTIVLEGMVSNCTVTGQNPQTAHVKVGGLTRDTARIRFDIVCVRTEKIAFVHGNLIAHAYADGSNAVSIATGDAPSWSPNGDLLVFESIRCSASANYSEPPGTPTCLRLGLAVIRHDGTFHRPLTDNVLDRNPAWSPDGELIAFDQDRDLRLVNANGTANVRLAAPVLSASQPAWAPDGTRIAFTCEVTGGNLDICAINRDGTGFLRLTSSPGPDTEPAWSPDGTRIAFTTMLFTGRLDIAVMSESGGNPARVIAGSSAAWSGDGSRLVFAIPGLGVATVNPNGTGLAVLSRQGEYAPAWRR